MKLFLTILLLTATGTHAGKRAEIPQNVYLPDSPSNTFIGDDGVERQEWPIIQRELNKLINSVLSNTFLPDHFDNVIQDYNPPLSYNFNAVKSLLTQNSSYIQELANIAELALSIHDVVTKRPILLLRKGEYKTVTLNQQEISVLLANAFWCDFPKREAPFTEFATFPHANFFRVLDNNIQGNIEKLKCFFNYFQRIKARQGPGTILTFDRRTLTPAQKPVWKASTATLINTVVSTGTIEENGIGMLQVDFANKYIGGGILGNGLTQEEARFAINPELIASVFFTEELDDNEVLVMTGSEQFNKYTGYSSTFKFDGSFQDNAGLDSQGRRTTQILAIDAIQFSESTAYEQYFLPNLNRELNKAYCGFMYRSASPYKTPIATGKWGAGAFNGNPMYKFLIQLMAASQAGREMYMFTFNNAQEANEMKSLYNYLKSKNVSVGKLYTVFEAYAVLAQRDGNNVESIDSFVRRSV